MAVFTENCLRDGSKFGASLSRRVSIFLSLQPWAELGLGPMATCLAGCPAGIFLSASPQLSGPLPCFSQALLYHSSQFFFHPLSQFWAPPGPLCPPPPPLACYSHTGQVGGAESRHVVGAVLGAGTGNPCQCSQPTPAVLGAPGAPPHPGWTLQEKQQGRDGGSQPLVGISELRDQVIETPVCSEATTVLRSHFCIGSHHLFLQQ